MGAILAKEGVVSNVRKPRASEIFAFYAVRALQPADVELKCARWKKDPNMPPRTAPKMLISVGLYGWIVLDGNHRTIASVWYAPVNFRVKAS